MILPSRAFARVTSSASSRSEPIGIPLAILGIIFAVKLLRLESDQSGLLRPFAYVNIAASICFATFILAPLGLLLDAAGNVILGMLYLRRKSEPTAPEFV